MPRLLPLFCYLLPWMSILSPVLCGQETATDNDPAAMTEIWQIGIVVTAEGGPCRGVFASTPVPMDWPEQTVDLVHQVKSPQIRRVKFRNLREGVRQMVIEVPRLEDTETAEALLTFEVTKTSPPKTDELDAYQIPRRSSRAARRYLQPSPYIESRHPEIVAIAQRVGLSSPNAWAQAESVYDWVRSHVQYQESQLKGALAALHDGNGDCEEMTSLFVAICRAQNIPARMVWVPGHCYPEFYLRDSQGKGCWFACQAAGERAFGNLIESRPILQKGDSFRIPGDPEKKIFRYAQLIGSLPGNGLVHPKIRIVHQRVEGNPSQD